MEVTGGVIPMLVTWLSEMRADITKRLDDIHARCEQIALTKVAEALSDFAELIGDMDAQKEEMQIQAKELSAICDEVEKLKSKSRKSGREISKTLNDVRKLHEALSTVRQIIAARSDDTIIIRYDPDNLRGYPNPQALYGAMNGAFRNHFPGHKVVAVGTDVDISILRKGELNDNPHQNA